MIARCCFIGTTADNNSEPSQARPVFVIVAAAAAAAVSASASTSAVVVGEIG